MRNIIIVYSIWLLQQNLLYYKQMKVNINYYRKKLNCTNDRCSIYVNQSIIFENNEISLLLFYNYYKKAQITQNQSIIQSLYLIQQQCNCPEYNNHDFTYFLC
ncbi:hypothetical protein pb186bvf_007884 [Paramecium bursaria]